MTIKIDKDVPLPIGGTRGNAIYPWADLAVGESFAVPAPNASVSNGVAHAGRRFGRKFASRRRIESGVVVIRVWRLE